MPIIRMPRSAAALTLAAALAVPAAADMGALVPFLPPDGTDGAWSTALQAGEAFAIANGGDPGAIRYYYLDTAPGTDTRAEVRVTLPPDGDPDGFAGLLFGFDATTRGYHIYAVHGDGTFSLFRRSADGFSQVMSTSLDTPPAGSVVLAIEETGSQVAFSVDGAPMGSIGNDLLGDGGVGIAVGGIVTATFSDFVVETR